MLRLVKTKSGVVHGVSVTNSGKTLCATSHNQVRTFQGKAEDVTCSKCKKKLDDLAG